MKRQQVIGIKLLHKLKFKASKTLIFMILKIPMLFQFLEKQTNRAFKYLFIGQDKIGEIDLIFQNMAMKLKRSKF